MTGPLLVLGCGFTGGTIARRALAAGRRVTATVRSAERAQALAAELGSYAEKQGASQPAFLLLIAPRLDESIAEHVTPDSHVVIAFPPDGSTDARIAPALARAAAITYISSTGVYGERTGAIDDHTPTPAQPNERAQRILAAEASYRACGATVLRCPGIYGRSRGLHMRILRGEHRIPGDGSLTMSRIHVEDLASFALAAARTRGETFVVGDRAPVSHGEVARFVAETYGVPLPPSVPVEQVHETLRANRAVDPSRAIEILDVQLRYPSYREGMSRLATGL